MADFRQKKKLGEDYETGPIFFKDSFVAAEIPDFIRDASNYRTLTWILVKVCTIRFIRDNIKPGAVQWPSVETIIEKKSDILKSLDNFASDYKSVTGYLNQVTKDYASIAIISSTYNYPAYQVWIAANDGLNAEFDPAIYHYTGWQICKSDSV